MMRFRKLIFAPLLLAALLVAAPSGLARADSAAFARQIQPLAKILQGSSQLLLRTFEFDNTVFSDSANDLGPHFNAVRRERDALSQALARYQINAQGLTADETAFLEKAVERVEIIHGVIEEHVASQVAYASASASGKHDVLAEHAKASIKRRRTHTQGQILYNTAIARTIPSRSLTQRQLEIDTAMLNADLALIDQEIARIDDTGPAPKEPYDKSFRTALGDASKAIDIFKYVLDKVEARGAGQYDPALFAQIIAARNKTVVLYREALELYHEAGRLTWDDQGRLVDADIDAVLENERRFLDNRARASANAVHIVDLINRTVGGTRKN